MSPPPVDSTDRVQQTVNRIESTNQGGQLDAAKLHHEIFGLRKQDSTNGQVDKDAFKTDLAAVTKQLHKDGILPGLDIVGTGNGHASFRGISTPGSSPQDGSESLVTKAHGTTFTYDKNNHVQSWTNKDGDTWKYSGADGKYHEFEDGKKTDKTFSDVITVDGKGRENVTHPDGSTVTTSAWGGTIERDPSGQMTKETNGKSTKTFDYANGQLSAMTVETDGKKTAYSKADDGKFYSSTDAEHKNPLDIAVDPTRDGMVKITEQSGASTEERWGGTSVHRDSNNHLTSIDYRNGDKATKFTYDDNNDKLAGFSMTGEDGKTHTYLENNGMLSIDGAAATAGTVSASDAGRLLVTQTGDGSDKQFKSIQFDMGGSDVESAKFGDKILPTEITSSGGKISSFKYDETGLLTDVDARGYKLHKDGDKWLTADNKPADVVPLTESNGTFSVIHGDGTYDQWTAGGVHTASIPDTPEAIAKEAKTQKDAEANPPSSDGAPTTDGTLATDGSQPGDATAVQGDPSLASTICRDARSVANSMDSKGLCLKGVATALDMAGTNNIHGGSAYMAADRLARDDQFSEIPENTKLQPGDVVVHGTTKTNPYGHILVYLGNGMEASDHIAPLTNMDYGSFTRVFRPTG